MHQLFRQVISLRHRTSGMFYVSVDPHGKLGWESSHLHYVDTTAHVVEVLTEQVGNAYRAFLRKQGISYIIAGKTELDYGLALSKLKEKFNIETLMLGGGGVLNWSFLQAGMCDEISIVLAAAADGSPDTPPGFPSQKRPFGKQGSWLHAERGKGHGRRGSLAALYSQSMILHRRFLL